MEKEAASIGDRVSGTRIDRYAPVSPLVASGASFSNAPPIPIPRVIPSELVNLARIDLPIPFWDWPDVNSHLVSCCRARYAGGCRPASNQFSTSPQRKRGTIKHQRRTLRRGNVLNCDRPRRCRVCAGTRAPNWWGSGSRHHDLLASGAVRLPPCDTAPSLCGVHCRSATPPGSIPKTRHQ